MKKQDLQRLIKIEEKIHDIAKNELNLEYQDFEIDICPSEKFIEIMAYRGPTQIHNWRYGRDYDKIKTLVDHGHYAIPYEAVVNSTPPRAFLYSRNPMGIHAAVISHVCGHVTFYKINEYFRKRRQDLVNFMAMASERFLSYEKKYGIETVEPVIDAALALQFHVNPYDEETEEQKRLRVYNQLKRENIPYTSEYSDLIPNSQRQDQKIQEDIEAYNSKLWLSLKNKSPVEPTEDILRVIIDNSKKLDDWEIDICETLREEGIFYHPNAITHLMNEGFATISHEKIMRRLFELQLLTQEEHGQFNDANARVKAMSLYQVNPYAVGSAIYYDIENRWNKGRFGDDWDQCENIVEKETWDDKLNLGWQKCLDITRTHNDYFFVMEFLTEKLIEDMFLFIYQYVETHDKEKFIRTKHGLTEIKKLIISFYSHSTIPLIKVINTNPFTLVHSHFGLDLDLQYAVETLKHIYRLCGVPVYLQTVVDTAKVEIEVDGNKEPKIREL